MRIRFPQFRAVSACAVAAFLSGGCTVYGGGVSGSYHAYPDHHYDIPEGHMPPPGECRIWFPGRPPGDQPPPGDCRELERRVPSGAILVRG